MKKLEAQNNWIANNYLLEGETLVGKNIHLNGVKKELGRNMVGVKFSGRGKR
jgi:hypothetical protein